MACSAFNWGTIRMQQGTSDWRGDWLLSTERHQWQIHPLWHSAVVPFSSDWEEWIHFELLLSLLLMVTHIQVGESRTGWGWGEGCEWDLVHSGEADGVAALIYVPADIKGLCTWPFPNHYRRTINYGSSLIAASCKWKRDNKCMPGWIGVRLWRLSWEVGRGGL